MSIRQHVWAWSCTKRYSNQEMINDFVLVTPVQHCKVWNSNCISKLSYLQSLEWLVWQTFSSTWWSWLVDLTLHRSSLTSMMCMWQEKLELIDNIHKVKRFDNWILKYQISRSFIQWFYSSRSLCLLSPGAKMLSENIRHIECQEQFRGMP